MSGSRQGLGRANARGRGEAADGKIHKPADACSILDLLLQAGRMRG